jgi:hypothetical protein
MSKKRLLNEATVRRFMGLAGMESKLVSNALSEMYNKRDDEKLDEMDHKRDDEEKLEEKKHEDDEVKQEMKYKRDDEEKMEEMKYKRDDEEKMKEGMYNEEEPAADDEMAPMEDEAPEGDAEVELSPEQISKLKALKDAAMAAAEVVDMLDSAAGEEGDDMEGEAGEEAEVDMDKGPEEDEEVMEALSGINLELNEDELVQEVAKRVAARLRRAKKAQQQLDEALGRNKK